MTLTKTKQLGLILALACQAAYAQQASDEDELRLVYGDRETVSIATGSQQSLRRAPAVATVITAQDIAAMGATDLDQVLEFVPGIHVNRSANQYAPLYDIRGIVSPFTPQVLMLQNGIPITEAFVGNKGNVWAGYPVEHIARIEIIRGPGSALYGSDAFSGVINIITKNASESRGTEFGMRAGSFSTIDNWLLHGSQMGPVDVAFYLRRGSTNGQRRLVTADAQTRNDTLFGTHASLAPGGVNTGNEALDANLDLAYGKWRLRGGYKLRDDVGTGAGIASALDPVGKSKSERIMTDLSWTDTEFAENWSVGAMLSHMEYSQITPVDYQLLPPGLKLPTGPFPQGLNGGPDFSERLWRASAYATFSGLAGHHLRIGIGHDDIDLYRTRETRNFNYTAGGTPIPLPSTVDFSFTNPYMFPQRRKINYVYVQDEWNLARDWAMTMGVRHDDYSDFGGTTNPRFALVWDASLDLTAKLLYGRAFRAPAFVESYGITNPVAIGNPKLKPETNGTTELALSWQARPDTRMNLTVYRYAMDDIIRLVPNAVAGTGSTYNNTGGQHGHGAELEGQWNATRTLQLQGNVAWQKSIDEASNRDAGYAPHVHGNGQLNWQMAPAAQLHTQLNWVGERLRPVGDARAPLAGYKTLDLAVRTNAAKQSWQVSASIYNLFNADVREPSLGPGLALPFDLPMAPRTFSLQATLKL